LFIVYKLLIIIYGFLLNLNSQDKVSIAAAAIHMNIIDNNSSI